MIQDSDCITGVIKIEVSMETLRGPVEETLIIGAKGETLGEVGTLVQREVYETLRRVVEKHLFHTQLATQVPRKPT